ncbi:MAG: hypothetical protein J6L83_05620 [Clostridia bacterium]|nr:hypothetical protein [Clostridia bacterium]
MAGEKGARGGTLPLCHVENSDEFTHKAFTPAPAGAVPPEERAEGTMEYFVALQNGQMLDVCAKGFRLEGNGIIFFNDELNLAWFNTNAVRFVTDNI